MKHHRPSAVLEMPKGQLLWCIVCSKPWPCPDASGESATEVGRTHDPLCGGGVMTHDPLCVLDEPCDEETPEHGYCGFSAPLYCIHCHRWCICERLDKVRADEREQAAQRVREAQHEDWCVFHGTNPDANECDCFHAACIAAARGEEQ